MAFRHGAIIGRVIKMKKKKKDRDFSGSLIRNFVYLLNEAVFYFLFILLLVILWVLFFAKW